MLRPTCVPPGKLLRKCFEDICKLLVENESRLNDLDKGSGDGDTGTTLRNGAAGEHDLLTQHHASLVAAHRSSGSDPWLAVLPSLL